MKCANIHIVPKGQGWAVQLEGDVRPVSIHLGQFEAVEFAWELAKIENTNVVIHNREWKILAKETPGDHPYPPEIPEISHRRENAEQREEFAFLP